MLGPDVKIKRTYKTTKKYSNGTSDVSSRVVYIKPEKQDECLKLLQQQGLALYSTFTEADIIKMMQDEDARVATDPKYVEKIDKVQKKLDKIKMKQPSHELGQFLGISFNECDYTCASQCLLNAPLLGKLKESPVVGCVIN
jgi:hypothetical protein